MKKIKSCIGQALILLCTTTSMSRAIAFYDPIAPQVVPSGWFVNIEAGGGWPEVPDVLSVRNGAPLFTGLGNDLFSTNSPANGLVAAMAGYKWLRCSWWFPGVALALRYQHFFNDSVDGAITQYGLPAFKNYSYTFDMSADILSAYSKVDLFYIDRFIPYVDIGVGATFNHVRKYNEAPFPGITPRVNPAFADNNQTNIAFNVGAGMAYVLNPHLSVSFGYEFQYLGTMKTGNGVLTWSGTNLNFGNYKANLILVGITYFIDDNKSEK